MLAELHRAVACVGFEINLVVAVVVKCCPKLADGGGVVDGGLGNGGESLAIPVVASAAWHEAVDDSLEAFVGEDKVLPSRKVEHGARRSR